LIVGCSADARVRNGQLHITGNSVRAHKIIIIVG